MKNSIINILPDNIANKIAAGEVVQRPESVVKELLENSIDAGAKTVELFIKNAGKTLIQVVDNGMGMSEDDVKHCVLRHATSKIKDIADLEAIRTFGFRGEALSSISSVSKLEIRTEQKDSDIGTILKIEDDNGLVIEKGSFAKGTSIAVKNLFYNVPARRNFLKTNATELKHITDTFKKVALSYPEIEFKFFNEGDLSYDLPAGSFEERIEGVFGDNFIDALIEVNEPTDYISAKGYVSKPTFLKKSRGDQYLFINRRPVNSRIVNHAVFSAYENILEKGDYPFFVLYIDIDPAKVDFNVHPSKLEVKFDDENGIYSFTQAVVKKSIGSYDLVPEMRFDDKMPDRERLRFNSFTKTERGNFNDRPLSADQRPVERLTENRSPRPFSDDDIDNLFNSISGDYNKNTPSEPVDHPFMESERKPMEIYHSPSGNKRNEDKEATDSSFIVMLHNKYILSQIKSGLMIIDSHVAHERILYEKALQSFQSNMPFSQQLLFSQDIQYDPGDYELLKELYGHLQKLGFEIKFLPKNQIRITGVPSDVNIGSEVNTLAEILDEYKKNQQEKDLSIRDNVAASYSCKAAIKAGDKLSEIEMRELVDKLFATSMPYVCPHGRPIVIKIPLLELDRRFGRT